MVAIAIEISLEFAPITSNVFLRAAVLRLSRLDQDSDGQIAQPKQNIFREVPLNLHQRILPSMLEAQGPEGVPVIVHGAKGVLGRILGCQRGHHGGWHEDQRPGLSVHASCPAPPRPP